MIQEFVREWDRRKGELRSKFERAQPENYKAIVEGVVELLSETGEYCHPDASNIHEIDDGNYQGTLVYVIPETGYQPRDYWYVKVGYGSCSGCDTLEAIRGYSDEKPTKEEVDQYMTLALHVLQGIKKMGEEVEE